MREQLAAAARALRPASSARIAIFAFPERGVGTTLLGEYVMDKLTTAFGANGGVELVERSRLEAIREEQALSASGEITDDSAVSIGNMAGAEAVVVGTLTNLGSEWELTARLLGAEDGKIRAVAEARFAAAAVPPGLAGVLVKGSPTRARATPTPSAPAEAAVYTADFSQVPEGELPPGWEADEGVGVVKLARGKALGSLTVGRHKISVGGLSIPSDFEIETSFEFWGGCPNFKSRVGAVEAGIGSCHHYFLTGASIPSGPPTAEKQRLTYTLRKQGAVFKFLIDGAQVGMSRVPSFEAASTVIIEVHPSFVLHSLKVRKVEL